MKPLSRGEQRFPPCSWGFVERIPLAPGITESQNGQDWKGPLWVIYSNPPAEAGSPTAGMLEDDGLQERLDFGCWS